MNMIRPLAHTILPHPARAFLRTVKKEVRRKVRPLAFSWAFAEFQKLENFDDVDRRLLERLTYGWGNHYSAHIEYMAAYLRHASQSQGPILECGSGLSTLLLGVVAARNGNEVWSLEHSDEWGSQVQQLLQRWRLTSVRLTIDKLRRYTHFERPFEWYRLPTTVMPQEFSLVVCDGPPGDTTRGGRYGLMPLMAQHLGDNCAILLDDFERASEQAIVNRWQREVSCVVEAHGSEEKYAVITVGPNKELCGHHFTF
jgi:hypothetical protein